MHMLHMKMCEVNQVGVARDVIHLFRIERICLPPSMTPVEREMSTPTSLKAEGNAHHAAGAHDLAVATYSQALALLLVDESAGEEYGPGELPRLQLRAALLANRAAAHLAAGASLCAASLTQCIADCDACLALGLVDGHPLCVKARFRKRGAEALRELAVLRQAAEAQLEAGSWADALRSCDAALALPARAAAPATLLRGAPHVASLERLAGLALCKVGRFALALARSRP